MEMKLLWQYLRPHRKLVIFSLILAALAQLASLIDPVIFGLIIDRFAAPKQVWLKGSWWAVSFTGCWSRSE
jgi:ABC-type multidrug transport system fused ATPase/permease subunit